MGQAESLSKFEGNEILTEMDAKLLHYRKSLMALVQHNADTSQVIISLIALPVPISMKYACLDVKQLFSLNNKTVQELKRIPLALGILEKYGRHLLKPVTSRAEMWRSVKFSNPIYKQRVIPLKGSCDIMKLMGYTMIVEDGVYFPENLQPDHNHTLNLVCDLIISKTEIELYLSGKHPQSSDIEQFLPEDIVAKINELVHGTVKASQPTINVQGNKMEISCAIEKRSEDKPTSVCEICLCNEPEVYCEACDNKILCKTCDVKWHQHPRRQHEETKRKKYDSNFVTQTQPRIAHQGAYGVSEVIQRKSNNVSMPVEKPQQTTSFESYMKIESPTDRFSKSLVQSPSSPVENIDDQLRKHHLKFKSYSEQSTKYQPVKFSASSFKNASGGNKDVISYPPQLNLSSAASPGSFNVHVTENISPELTRSESKIMPSSQKKSKILSEIVMLPDASLRKSTCQINITTVDAQILELDKDLNKILSQDDQFLQNYEFVSLNRKKSTLIREKKTLEEYLKEIDASTSEDTREVDTSTSEDTGSKVSHLESTVKDQKEVPPQPQVEASTDSNDETRNWFCQYCTLSNPIQQRVCGACNKTNDQANISTTEPMNESAHKPQPTVLVLENVGNKFNDLQDIVYLEKKAAQSMYNNQFQQESVTSTNLVQTANNPSTSSSTPTKSSAFKSIPNIIAEENCSTFSHTEPQLPSRQYHDIKQTIEKKDPGTTATFQEIMKVNTKMKLQKEMKENGFKLFNIIKIADERGYDVEEVEVALEQLGDDSLEVIEWLDNYWQQYIDMVFEKIRSRSTDLVNDTVGEISTKEVKDALKKCKGDIDEAVLECVTRRQLLYSQFNFDESFQREDVLYTMLECIGDADMIQNKLNQIALQPFVERIWEGVDIPDNFERFNSVSNSIIERENFQEIVRNANLCKERRTRMVFMEGKLKSWGRAETVIKIVDEEMGKENFQMSTLEDVIEAVRNCGGFKPSVAYLQQTCEICFTDFPMNKIMSLNICQCKLCVECIKLHFQHCVKDMNVRKWSCPVCGRPNMTDPDIAQNYLSFLKLLIGNYCDQPTQDLFDKKANLWNIQQDENFRWCAHCETGFIFHGAPNQLCMTCDNCSKKTCFQCKKEWEVQHEGITCQEFEQWKYDNDPSNQAVGLANHLKENGIDCPLCKMRYSLSKGGCMHFTCPQCSHEFCSGCCQPFYHDNTCPFKCVGKGLHCHHPRDCFFFLRDEEPTTLQKLLQMNKKSFDKDVNESGVSCPVMEQKERSQSSNYDEACGKEVKAGWAGLCIDHYKEYLVGLINKHNLDPLDVIQAEERLRIILKRLNVSDNVIKRQNEKKAEFIERLKKIIQEEEPLKRRYYH